MIIITMVEIFKKKNTFSSSKDLNCCRNSASKEKDADGSVIEWLIHSCLGEGGGGCLA